MWWCKVQKHNRAKARGVCHKAPPDPSMSTLSALHAALANDWQAKKPIFQNWPGGITRSLALEVLQNITPLTP